jgi:hypothetical protein
LLFSLRLKLWNWVTSVVGQREGEKPELTPFSFSPDAFAFLAFFFLRDFALVFCVTFASVKVRKKRGRPPLLNTSDY